MKRNILKTGSATPGESEEREQVDAANDRALYSAMLEFNIHIHASVIGEWRATKRNIGDIAGVREGLTILMTDGCQAWFATQDGRAFHGHKTQFSGKVEPMFSVVTRKVIKFKDPRVKAKATGTARAGGAGAKVNLALDLLKEVV